MNNSNHSQDSTEYVSIPSDNESGQYEEELHLSSDIEEELVEVDLSYSLKFVNPQKKSEYTI